MGPAARKAEAMTVQWKVTCRISSPFALAQPSAGYPTLGIKFVPDAENRLTEIEHELDADDSRADADILDESEGRIQVLLDALNFRRGTKVVIASRDVQKC